MNLFNLYERLARAFPLFDKISSRLLFSDSCIYEALFFKFLTVIDITSVNDDIACHHLLDDIPRRHAELAPVSHHGETSYYIDFSQLYYISVNRRRINRKKCWNHRFSYDIGNPLCKNRDFPDAQQILFRNFAPI